MKKLIASLLVFLVLFFLGILSPVRAITCDDTQPTGNETLLKEFITACESKVGLLNGQVQTVDSAIAYLNTQIKLMQAKIATTANQLENLEVEIADLTGRIDSIDYSLVDLTKLFVSRVRQTYMERGSYDAFLISQSSGLPDFLRTIEYTKKVRDHDREILIALEKSRLDFNTQKKTKEIKQIEVEKLKQKLDKDKSALASQIAIKEKLLADIKNNRSLTQQRLADAQAELLAIQGIIAGLGVESKVGPVSEGSRVATIIVGKSPCSSGTHLHYEVAQNGSRRNPFELLKSTSLTWDNSDSVQNGNGSWNWPLNDPIRITQGYGHTSYSSIYANSVHTGVDMVNSENYTVKAVKAGELYLGGMKCGNGTLKYVHVKQDDGFDSYYLHVNY